MACARGRVGTGPPELRTYALGARDRHGLRHDSDSDTDFLTQWSSDKDLKKCTLNSIKLHIVPPFTHTFKTGSKLLAICTILFYIRHIQSLFQYHPCHKASYPQFTCHKTYTIPFPRQYHPVRRHHTHSPPCIPFLLVFERTQ